MIRRLAENTVAFATAVGLILVLAIGAQSYVENSRAQSAASRVDTEAKLARWAGCMQATAEVGGSPNAFHYCKPALD